MTVSVTMPKELYRKAAAMAAVRKISVEEVLASALADQLAAWERLQARAAAGNREKFLAALDRVPDVEPEDDDRH